MDLARQSVGAHAVAGYFLAQKVVLAALTQDMIPTTSERPSITSDNVGKRLPGPDGGTQDRLVALGRDAGGLLAIMDIIGCRRRAFEDAVDAHQHRHGTVIAVRRGRGPSRPAATAPRLAAGGARP